jgi:hypothetical protein
MVALITLRNNGIGHLHETHLVTGVPRRVWIIAGGCILGFYDGFFGPGTGSFLILLFAWLLKCDFVKANGNTSVDLKSLGPLAKNINATAYLPQLDILPCAGVAMTHGGMGTTMEALSFGVPLVIIPQMPEQALTARRVVELGLGLMMTRDEATPQSLMAAVEHVVGDATIQSNVALMQQQLDVRRHRPGYLLAADTVESYLA